MIPICAPNIKKYTKSAIDAIETGWISNHGTYISLANTKLKKILNVNHLILMANGTVATHCLFISIKYKYPHINKIYVPNNCYVAAWNAALMEYSKEQLSVMNMNIDTWNINTSEEYINTLDENSAVLIVHNLGNIVNVPRLKRLRPDLIFVEDNCEGLLGKYENIYSGTSSASLCSSISFYGNKVLTTGEGGAFMTNDTELFNYINKVYSQGVSEERYVHDVFAYNYRMTNIQAAFLYDQLSDIDNIVGNRKNIFDKYTLLLNNLIENNKIKLLQSEEHTVPAQWMFAIRIVNNKLSINELYNYFIKNEIDTRPFFYPINKHGHLKDIVYDDNNAILLNKEIIMLPTYPDLTEEDQKKVVDALNNLLI
jgi:perosamine synthetase